MVWCICLQLLNKLFLDKLFMCSPECMCVCLFIYFTLYFGIAIQYNGCLAGINNEKRIYFRYQPVTSQKCLGIILRVSSLNLYEPSHTTSKPCSKLCSF